MLDKFPSVVITQRDAVSRAHLARKTTETTPNSDLAAAQLMTRTTVRLNCHLPRLLLLAAHTAGGTVGRALVVVADADAVLARSLAAPSLQKWPGFSRPFLAEKVMKLEA